MPTATEPPTPAAHTSGHDDPDGLYFMTAHQAKGKEFDAMILLPASKRWFPADDEGRRLLYVAITRARSSCGLARTSGHHLVTIGRPLRLRGGQLATVMASKTVPISISTQVPPSISMIRPGSVAARTQR